MTLSLLLFAALLGLIPAAIANHKGQGFFFWWIFGALLFIVALPLAILAKDSRPRCPDCAEHVQTTARVCPHCLHDLPQWVGTRWWRHDERGARQWFEPGVGWHTYQEDSLTSD